MGPAFGEFARRLMRMPELMQAAAFAYFGATPTGGVVESFMRLTRGLPNGLFDNGAIASYLARLFSQPGRTDDFRKLPHKLFIVATDLDSGKSTPFGAPGLDHVPISEAVKAGGERDAMFALRLHPLFRDRPHARFKVDLGDHAARARIGRGGAHSLSAEVIAIRNAVRAILKEAPGKSGNS